MKLTFNPPPGEVKRLVASGAGNTIPVYADIAADLLTPVSAYLKLSKGSDYSFLLESVAGGEKIGRYSLLGAFPHKVVKCGPKEAVQGDPLSFLEKDLSSYKYVSVPGVPKFSGGAIGYISYDCVQYFEPRTKRDLADPIGIPDAIFMFCDTVVVFDHLRHVMTVVSHFKAEHPEMFDMEVDEEYSRVTAEITRVVSMLNNDEVPMPEQPPIVLNPQPVSNVGQAGYEAFVEKLKFHINEGDIIQAVPAQRLSRPTTLHPFNAYRQLRSVNPSPYMFYVDLKEFQLVGASPEMLVKVEDGHVTTHPIAGTRRRGKTPEEDEAMAQELLGDIKERAEHIMLVDLGRNDVNRICEPSSVRVDSLMHIERYSHVMHIVSHVSGKLRADKTAYDAFRSIFPAGTVSGAPKIRAMELIYDCEKEKRGVYAGSVGFFDFAGNVDTCIAIRTMLFKDGLAYLQAGAGIVYDSIPTMEFKETEHKLRSNVTALELAEKHHYTMQQMMPKKLEQTIINAEHLMPMANGAS